MVVGIACAEMPGNIDAVRVLFRDFFAWAMAHVAEEGKFPNASAFADLGAELAGLPGRFGPPSGCLPLVRLDGAPVGCVAFYGQDATTMEIKRMFVRPKAWGRGVGKRMLEMLLAEVTTAGYTRYRLSTHHKLHTAQSLYRRTGYSEVPGSPGFPGIVEGVDICMEMRPVRTALKEKHLA